jgi:hypothetical protein
MIPRSMASGFDPMGGNRLSDKITLKTKNLDRDPIQLNWITVQRRKGDVASGDDPGDRFRF